MSRKSSLQTFLIAALGAVAMLALPSVSAAKDRNHDRIPDRWEKRHHLSLKVKQAGRDQDRDLLRNRAEFLTGDDPRDRDSDDDGVVDGDENAGTIESFDAETGRLVITLFGGDSVAGLVTEDTKIKCEDEHSAAASDSGEEELSDDHGEESGDDHHGEDGEESGDDHGDDDSESGSSGSGPSSHDDNGTGANCTTADLIPGAVVEEAELELEHGTATFDEVELAD